MQLQLDIKSLRNQMIPRLLPPGTYPSSPGGNGGMRSDRVGVRDGGDDECDEGVEGVGEEEDEIDTDDGHVDVWETPLERARAGHVAFLGERWI